MSSDFIKLHFVLEKIEDLESFLSRYSSMCLLQIGETLKKLKNEYKELSEQDIKGAYEVRNFIAHD